MGETTLGLDELQQAYDTAMKLWADECLMEMAKWLDPSVAALPRSAFRKLPTVFAAPLVTADLLVAAGHRRLLHVEYESRPRDDLVRRMYDYRGRMMREFPGYRLTQHIVVLGTGVVRGYDDLDRFGFALDVRLVYLRDHDPAEFLADPIWAPFAALARGTRVEREQSLGAAIRLISNSEHPQRRVLLQVAEALARIRLPPLVIERIERESGMNIQPLVNMYLTTEVGHRIEDIGREKGLEQGREQGREEMLLALLRSRFGDGSELGAAAHARLPASDRTPCVAGTPQRGLHAIHVVSAGP